MADDPIYLRRSLNVTTHDGLTCLDCLSIPSDDGASILRAFFARGADAGAFSSGEGGPVAITQARGINGGLVLEGTFGETTGDVALPLKSGVFSVAPQLPETELFDGLNTCIAERNGEKLSLIESWLRYHIENFGLRAVLLIDRAPPAQVDKFGAKLAKLAKKLGLTRLVHVSAEYPLGAADLPAAQHPFNAPDAPGKDRMDALTPDPWSAPLAEQQLYEWAKWRFLSDARAVMNLDLSDLLVPGTDPFEAVQTNTSGTVSLQGMRIYPWRVRKGDQPGFGDHICRQFDPSRANRRWCAAPKRLGQGPIWRLTRIVGAAPEPSETSPFWRAMAVRHPQASTSEIVPKTSLIEDPQLCDFARDVFAHKPVRAPENTVTDTLAEAVDAGRTCIVTCMKNEGPFILEWIAYHRAIGVDDFLIYTNDCDDGTDEILDLLQDRGIVQRRDNLFKNSDLRPQHWALKAAEDESVVQNSGWIVSMDVDEFINIHVGDGHLRDLYGEVGDANMISMTWRLFGNSDVAEFSDDFITDQFTRCAPELARKPHQAWGFKTLFRNIGIYKKMGVHRPKGLRPDLWDQIKWVNGSGRPMPQKLLRNGWRSTVDSYGYDLVTLNHYAVRSAESFLVKRDRGRVNHVDRDQGLSYWFRMNNNWQEDRSIQSKRALLRKEFDRLLEDPDIRAAHEFSLKAHRARIKALKATDNYRAFYGDLVGERMKRLSRLHPYFGANVFLAGPQVVPDEIVSKDAFEPKFFFTVERQKTTH